MPVRLTRAIIKALDQLAQRTLPPQDAPQHQQTGLRGEEDAYFYLCEKGYTIVARNFRSPRRKGEIDLIGWDGNVLCFIEVKTRTSHDVPAEAAVHKAKRRELVAVAREYLRRMPPPCQWRCDVVSVYYEDQPTSRPGIELFKNAFSMSYNEKSGAAH